MHFFRIKPKKYRTNYQFIHKSCVVIFSDANLNIIVEKGAFLQKQIISILCNSLKAIKNIKNKKETDLSANSLIKLLFDVASYNMKPLRRFSKLRLALLLSNFELIKNISITPHSSRIFIYGLIFSYRKSKLFLPNIQ